MEVMEWSGNIQEIINFYKSVDYEYDPKEDEKIIAAVENKSEVLGVVRLSKEEGIVHLRGMQVRKKSRNKGVGTKILEKVVNIINKDKCYLVGYPHLANFYGQIGFREVDFQEVPKSVQERSIKASERFPKKDFNIMVRESN